MSDDLAPMRDGCVDYIAEIMPELRTMALAGGHELLGYLLELAQAEALRIGRDRTAASGGSDAAAAGPRARPRWSAP